MILKKTRVDFVELHEEKPNIYDTYLLHSLCPLLNSCSGIKLAHDCKNVNIFHEIVDINNASQSVTLTFAKAR